MQGDLLWLALEETTSTNTVVREEVMAGRAIEAVCWATRQSQGRGRLGRTWQSPEGGLYFSWAVPVGEIPPVWFQPLAGLAVLDALQEKRPEPSKWMQQHIEVGLKWPNDIIVRSIDRGETTERKLGGILSEYLTTSIGGPHVVVGIGLNINTDIHLTEEEMAKHALPPISWKEVTAESHDTKEIAEALYTALRRRLQTLQTLPTTQAATVLREAWSTVCWTLGTDVRVLQPDGGQIEGRAVAITQDLSLILEDAQGRRHTITAGDCRHLRRVR